MRPNDGAHSLVVAGVVVPEFTASDAASVAAMNALRSCFVQTEAMFKYPRTLKSFPFSQHVGKTSSPKRKRY